MGDGLIAAGEQAPAITLRPATADDARLLLAWRNEEGVREAAFNREPIEWDTHVAWLESKLARGVPILIGLVNGEEFGVARIDTAGHDPAVVEIHVSVDRERRGAGLGRALIAAAASEAEAGGAQKIIARIRPGNSTSIAAFAATGFEPASADPGAVIMVRHRAAAP